METKHLIRDFTNTGPSESFHYKGRPITETEANFVPPVEDFQVKAMIERESYDMIYNAGKWEGRQEMRAEIVAMVMNLLRENPNIDGLEILKKL